MELGNPEEYIFKFRQNKISTCSQRKLKEGITTGRAKEGVKESNLDSRSSKMWPTFQYLSNFLRPEVECLLQSLNMSISTEMINRFPHT